MSSDKVEESVQEVEVEDDGEFEAGLNWHGFCRKYAEAHSIKYSIAIIEAGKAWKDYKEKHGVVPKKKPIEKPDDFNIRRHEVPLGKGGKRYKTRISIKPPPKGYKVAVSYIPDNDDAEEPIIVSASGTKVSTASKVAKFDSKKDAADKAALVAKRAAAAKKKSEVPVAKVVKELSEGESEYTDEEEYTDDPESGEEA